ncbi:MAG: DUF503 domain-containing protein [Anaerolineae bacterium]|nr:DUF503 domain-containing protein [Anaerolineae bacterium]
MVVGVCTIQLEVFGDGSLKGKRHVVKPILARVRNHFNVAAAEVDDLDSWQRSTLAFVCVSNDAAYAHGLLEKVIDYIERNRFDANILDYQIELL